MTAQDERNATLTVWLRARTSYQTEQVLRAIRSGAGLRAQLRRAVVETFTCVSAFEFLSRQAVRDGLAIAVEDALVLTDMGRLVLDYLDNVHAEAEIVPTFVVTGAERVAVADQYAVQKPHVRSKTRQRRDAIIAARARG